MKKNHIVILYIHTSSRLAHIKKIRKLKKNYEITILHANVPNKDYIGHFCHNEIAVNTEFSDSNISKIITELNLLTKPDGIINISEPFLPIHSRLCSHYNLIGPSEEAVHVGRNKFNMRNFAKSLNIPIPNYVLVTSETINSCKKLKFPIVVKPIVGSGSTLVKRYDNFEDFSCEYFKLNQYAKNTFKTDSEFHKTVKEDYPYIAEEIIGGILTYKTRMPVTIGEISVESVFYNDEVIVLAIHDKPLPSNGPYYEEIGYSTPTRIPVKLQEKALEYVKRIHNELGVGAFVLHTEFRTFENDLVLIEFGVRMGGGAIYNSLLLSTGTDFIEVQIDIVLNMPLRIGKSKPIPTITQYLFPDKQGEIVSFVGETKIISEPTYVEHQLYDEVGEVAYRAPLAKRSALHVIFQDHDIDFLEERALRAANDFVITT